MMHEPAQNVKTILFSNKTMALTPLIAFKMAYSCCLSLVGNQEKVYSINY